MMLFFLLILFSRWPAFATKKVAIIHINNVLITLPVYIMLMISALQNYNFERLKVQKVNLNSMFGCIFFFLSGQ